MHPAIHLLGRQVGLALVVALVAGAGPVNGDGRALPPAVPPVAEALCPPDAPDALALIPGLEAWLDAHLDLRRPPVPPAVALVSPGTAKAALGVPRRGYGAPRGYFDPDAGTVWLVAPWSAEKPQDVAVLLHELVHARQVGHVYPCAGAREFVAYRAQRDWLDERGLTLDVNWLAIVLDAGCRPRDIHPE